MTRHLKRYYTPKTWKIKKKGIKFVTKPSSGPHKMGVSVPVNVMLRDIIHYSNTNREVKFILGKKEVAVDGTRRRDPRFPIGLFDVLSLNDINEHYRVILDNKGKISLIKIGKEESMLKLCKIIGKKILAKGKVQVNLYDGKNIIVKEDSYKVGDSILIDFNKKNEIKDKVALGKGVLVYLIGGKHIGVIGKVQDIIGNRILYKTESGEIVETSKEYAFPVGKEKPLIKLTAAR